MDIVSGFSVRRLLPLGVVGLGGLIVLACQQSDTFGTSEPGSRKMFSVAAFERGSDRTAAEKFVPLQPPVGLVLKDPGASNEDSKRASIVDNPLFFVTDKKLRDDVLTPEEKAQIPMMVGGDLDSFQRMEEVGKKVRQVWENMDPERQLKAIVHVSRPLGIKGLWVREWDLVLGLSPETCRQIDALLHDDHPEHNAADGTGLSHLKDETDRVRRIRRLLTESQRRKMTEIVGGEAYLSIIVPVELNFERMFCTTDLRFLEELGFDLSGARKFLDSLPSRSRYVDWQEVVRQQTIQWTPAQRDRFEQLYRQWRGPSSIVDTEVASKLGLRAEQLEDLNLQVTEIKMAKIKQLDEIRSKLIGKTRGRFIETPAVQKAQERLRALYEETRQAELEVTEKILGPQKMEQWRQIIGPVEPDFFEGRVLVSIQRALA